eukprot:gene6342-15_t
MRLAGNEKSEDHHKAFAKDVQRGLNAASGSRFLSSLYFYDDAGSEIFAEITELPEYYLTRCEFEVLRNPTHQLAITDALRQAAGLTAREGKPYAVRLVELGAGDGRKTSVLLEYLQGVPDLKLSYYPIDYSEGALVSLAENMGQHFVSVKPPLPADHDPFDVRGQDCNAAWVEFLPLTPTPYNPIPCNPLPTALHSRPLQPYLAQNQMALAREHPSLFTMVPLVSDNSRALTWLAASNEEAVAETAGVTMVLFLGSSIGNMNDQEAVTMMQDLVSCLQKDDLLLVGFDLVKDVNAMINAYSDNRGVTARFNHNLLTRINTELGADFVVNEWKHEASWNPDKQTMESHLVSKRNQSVYVAGLKQSFDFAAGEALHTEFSHKYTQERIQRIATGSGLEVIATLDSDDGGLVDTLFK